MPTDNLLVPFGASMIIGALIGLEREKYKQTLKNRSPIGIRTCILISLFGALSAYLGQTYDPAIFLISLGAMIILIVSSHISLIARFDRIGVTTEITTILLFLFGSMCVTGQIQTAVMLSILTTLVLSLREYLHGFVKQVNQRELSDTIKFAIIAFIILPFLPDRNYDDQILGFILPAQALHNSFQSMDVLNPHKIWFLVVLGSAVSFAGYILVKMLGKKAGLSLTGFMGGLYSSTATSITLSARSKELPNTSKPFIAGILLACSASFLKMFILIRALNEELFMRTIIPIGTMFFYLLGAGIYEAMGAKHDKNGPHKTKENFETPFKLKSALKLGGFIVAALIVAKISLAYSSIDLYYIVATGMAFLAIDDPIVISTASTAGTLIDFANAKNIIVLVIFLNMIQKVGMMYIFGNKRLVKRMAMIFGGLFLVTLVSFVYF